jgi:hypothetical protein
VETYVYAIQTEIVDMYCHSQCVQWSNTWLFKTSHNNTARISHGWTKSLLRLIYRDNLRAYHESVLVLNCPNVLNTICHEYTN